MTRFLGTFILVILGLGIGLVCAEILIRIFVQEPPLDGTNLVYQIDTRIGWKYAPNQVGKKQSMCYNVAPITINEFGFRDDVPWDEAHRIALIGDSFVAAAEVGDDAYLGKRLETALGEPVMNAASAQGYSTIQEYRVFEDYVAQFKPKVVLLLFFLGNDVLGNGCETGTFDLPQNYRLRPCGTVSDDGTIAMKEPEVEAKDLVALNDLPSLKVFLKEHCRLCTLAWSYVQGYMRNENTENRPEGERVDIQTPGAADTLYAAETDRAWQVTEEYIKRFDQLVRDNGGQLAVIALPDLVTLNKYWNDESAGTVQPGDPVPWERYALPERLEAIVKKTQAHYVDLTPFLMAYQTEHRLPPEFFSYSCDLHFNPAGHEAVANMIAGYLKGEEWYAALVR